MAKKDETNQSLFSAWEVEVLRLTAFPDPAAQMVESDWWEKVLNEPAETKISRPRERLNSQEKGEINGGELVLTIRPDRIDWTFGPVVDPEEDKFQSIGSLLEGVQVFLPPMLRWFGLDDCPRLIRLAFGAIVFQPVPDLDQGYRKLLEDYLPSVQVDLKEARNFFYQINRRRPSKSGVEGLSINRLSKWSVMARRGVHFRISQDSLRYEQQHEDLACRLELDMNTVPEFEGEFAPQMLPKIFQELVDFGIEITEKGDIP